MLRVLHLRAAPIPSMHADDADAAGLAMYLQPASARDVQAHACPRNRRGGPDCVLAGAAARGFDAYEVLFDGQPLAIGEEREAAPGVTVQGRC